MTEEEAKERRAPVVELKWTTEDGMNQSRAYDVARALGKIASEMMVHTNEYEVAHSTINDKGNLLCYSVYMKRVGREEGRKSD